MAALTSTSLGNVHERGVQVLVLDSVQAVNRACDVK